MLYATRPTLHVLISSLPKDNSVELSMSRRERWQLARERCDEDSPAPRQFRLAPCQCRRATDRHRDLLLQVALAVHPALHSLHAPHAPLVLPDLEPTASRATTAILHIIQGQSLCNRVKPLKNWKPNTTTRTRKCPKMLSSGMSPSLHALHLHPSRPAPSGQALSPISQPMAYQNTRLTPRSSPSLHARQRDLACDTAQPRAHFPLIME